MSITKHLKQQKKGKDYNVLSLFSHYQVPIYEWIGYLIPNYISQKATKNEYFSVTKLVHESLMKVCQPGDDCWNLVLLRKYCASKMPGAWNLSKYQNRKQYLLSIQVSQERKTTRENIIITLTCPKPEPGTKTIPVALRRRWQ